MDHHFINFINKYSNKPWNWTYLSVNPNITFDIIEKYIDKPWNCFFISLKNNNTTFDIVEKYIDNHGID